MSLTVCSYCSGRGWVWFPGSIDPDEPERDICPACQGEAK